MLNYFLHGRLIRNYNMSAGYDYEAEKLPHSRSICCSIGGIHVYLICPSFMVIRTHGFIKKTHHQPPKILPTAPNAAPWV
jgi:hypothetical protein